MFASRQAVRVFLFALLGLGFAAGAAAQDLGGICEPIDSAAAAVAAECGADALSIEDCSCPAGYVLVVEDEPAAIVEPFTASGT